MINEAASLVTAPFLEEGEVLIWADMPDEKRNWFPFIFYGAFYVFWFGFSISMFISGLVESYGSNMSGMAVVMFLFGAVHARFMFMELLSEVCQFYALTNKRGLLVTHYDVGALKFLGIKKSEAISIYRTALRLRHIEREGEKGTLTFRDTASNKTEPVARISSFYKEATQRRIKFRNIKEPDVLNDLIQLHFFGKTQNKPAARPVIPQNSIGNIWDSSVP